MRPLFSSGLALVAGILLVSVAEGEVRRSTERPPEVRRVDRTLPAWPVKTPVRSMRIPSRWIAGPPELPGWLAEETSGGSPSRPAVDDAVAPRGPLAPPPSRVSRLATAAQQTLGLTHEFYFTRAAYTGGRGGYFGRGAPAWATDYPKADIQFLIVLKRLTNLDAWDDENAIRLDDPRIRQFPFLYALEVGYMTLSPPEIAGLRAYLDAGGFLMVDDFWGTREWAAFEYQISRVLPGRPIQDIPLDHPLFDMVYDIDEVLQVPALGRGIYGRPTYERDGYVPTVSGIFDDDGRLMAVLNWNTDLGDAWEHAENPMYPVEFSTYAFQVGVNTVVYGMSH